MNYWERVLPTYIENWPNALCSLSIAQVDVPLTVEEARRLGSNIIEWGETFGPMQPIEDIRARVADAVDRFPAGAFVRIGSRSPKDSWDGHRNGFRILPGTDPLRFLLDVSERIYEDLTLAIQHDYAPHIFVRQWQNILRWAEFRCFMRDRKLVGISQYNYLDNEVFQEILGEHKRIEQTIHGFFEQFRTASHLDDVVFDVFLKHGWECRLLEINPFFEMTDPCLFTWTGGGDFDGSFRYHGKPAAEEWED